MRKNKTRVVTEELDRELLNHIRGLGLSTVEAYREWCDQNGFSRKLKKSWNQRCQERNFSLQSVAMERLQSHRRESRNQSDVLREVIAGERSENEVTLPHLKRLCENLRISRRPKHERRVNRKVLLRLFEHLHNCRAKFFDGSPAVASLGQISGNTYVEALAQIAANSSSWQRPVEDWKPRSHSSSRQFASLLRHLFVKYDDVPLFLDTVWFTGNRKDAAERRSWYIHVGRGQNIRHCKLPIPLTKKMAHLFMRSPNELTIDQALRWAQVLGLGGDEHLARAIIGTRLIDQFQNDEFWSSVIRWFISHPMLDRTQVGPIIDYLQYQRFVPEHVYIANGQREETSPPQPNLSMNGRTPESLLRQVHDWHRKLNNDNRYQIQQWKSSGIQNYEFIEGSEKKGTLRCWTIRELLSSKALLAEGRQMKHCVATYADSCARGFCSIWTMEVESFGGMSKAVTVEVRKSERMICQIRGKANRLPNDKEKQIIQRWAESEGLRVASYI